MKRRSGVSDQPAKAQRRKTAARKNRVTPKAARPRNSSTAREETEVARLTRERDEAFQQQAATADVLKVISRSTFDLQTVLNTLVESAARLCAADICAIVMKEGDVYRNRAHYGLAREAVQYALLQPLRPGRASVTGRVAMDGKAIHVHDVLADPQYSATDHQQAFGYRTFLGVPLQRNGATIGVLNLTRRSVKPFSEKQIELATTFADQAVIAIENARLLNELRESLEQQTATSDVLRVISSSPTDIRPVLEIIGERAKKLCDAETSIVSLVDGGVISLASIHGMTEAGVEAARRAFPMRRTDETITARAIRTRSAFPWFESYQAASASL
jgi:transcriptional regulator with GAF, ATPase, and Fis domain